MGGNGKQLAVADLWSVRFRRGEWMGYAVRRGAAWDSVCVTGATLPPFMRLGVTALREWLADPDRPPAWYGEILLKQDAQALAAKQVACPGRGACAWVDEARGMHTHRGNGDIKPKVTKAAVNGG